MESLRFHLSFARIQFGVDCGFSTRFQRWTAQLVISVLCAWCADVVKVISFPLSVGKTNCDLFILLCFLLFNFARKNEYHFWWILCWMYSDLTLSTLRLRFSAVCESGRCVVAGVRHRPGGGHGAGGRAAGGLREAGAAAAVRLSRRAARPPARRPGLLHCVHTHLTAF